MGNFSTCANKLSVNVSPNSFIKNYSSDDNNGYSQLLNDQKGTFDKSPSSYSPKQRSY